MAHTGAGPAAKQAAAKAAAKALGGVGVTLGVAFGGLTALTALATAASRAVVVARKRSAGHVCPRCDGRKYHECSTCRGRRGIGWQPLKGPTMRRLCVCPTCGGKTGLQKCSNCVGQGFA